MRQDTERETRLLQEKGVLDPKQRHLADTRGKPEEAALRYPAPGSGSHRAAIPSRKATELRRPSLFDVKLKICIKRLGEYLELFCVL